MKNAWQVSNNISEDLNLGFWVYYYSSVLQFNAFFSILYDLSIIFCFLYSLAPIFSIFERVRFFLGSLWTIRLHIFTHFWHWFLTFALGSSVGIYVLLAVVYVYFLSSLCFWWLVWLIIVFFHIFGI